MTEFYKHYPSIEGPEIESFLKNARSLAEKLYGPAAIPVNRVYVREGNPTDTASNFTRGHKLCELVNAETGEFAIYLQLRPGDLFFWGQFGHETGHLQNARIFDPLMEGFATLFARHLLDQEHLPWCHWEAHLQADREPLYSRTYKLLSRLEECTGAEQIGNLLRHAEFYDGQTKHMRINLDSWVGLLPKAMREKVEIILFEHVLGIYEATKGDQNFSHVYLQKYLTSPN